MEPPPLPAVLVGSGLVLNLARSRRRNQPTPPRTISRWACRHKRVAVPVAVVGGAWVAVHWWLYVLDA